jgi:hypothetical protein
MSGYQTSPEGPAFSWSCQSVAMFVLIFYHCKAIRAEEIHSIGLGTLQAVLVMVDLKQFQDVSRKNNPNKRRWDFGFTFPIFVQSAFFEISYELSISHRVYAAIFVSFSRFCVLFHINELR